MKKPLALTLLVIAAVSGLWIWKPFSRDSYLNFRVQRRPSRRNEKNDSPMVSEMTPVNKLAHPPLSKIVQTQTLKDEDSEVSRKMNILTEILQSKNDNDPRLDRDFNHLTAKEKLALEEKYQDFKPESKNERGTIVFLLGKNLSSKQDFEFLRQVITEPPCLSLSDCNKPYEQSPEDAASGTQITLNYPAIVSLKSLENYLNQNLPESQAASASIEGITLAMRDLNEAANSANPIVSHMAKSLLNKFNVSSHNAVERLHGT